MRRSTSWSGTTGSPPPDGCAAAGDGGDDLRQGRPHARPFEPHPAQLAAVRQSRVEGDAHPAVCQTVAVVGPQKMRLSAAVRQVARITGRPVLIFPLPVFVHRLMAWCFEHTMNVPLISTA